MGILDKLPKKYIYGGILGAASLLPSGQSQGQAPRQPSTMAMPARSVSNAQQYADVYQRINKNKENALKNHLFPLYRPPQGVDLKSHFNTHYETAADHLADTLHFNNLSQNLKPEEWEQVKKMNIEDIPIGREAASKYHGGATAAGPYNHYWRLINSLEAYPKDVHGLEKKEFNGLSASDKVMDDLLYRRDLKNPNLTAQQKQELDKKYSGRFMLRK